MNVPKLRFKDENGQDFPAWEEKIFNEIFSFLSTNSFPRSLLSMHGLVKNIHYGDIHTKFKSNFKIGNENLPFIHTDVDISKISKECYCQEGDLVIADVSEDYADIGKAIEIISLDNQKLLAGLHTFLVRDASNKMALGFKGYLMQNAYVRSQIKKLATGVSVLGISKSNLSTITLYFPNIEEQTKIANFLSAIDERIAQLTKQNELLILYKKGAMQQIFSQQLRFKDENGQDFPAWEEKALGEIGTFFSGGTPLTSKRAFYDGDIPFIKSGELGLLSTAQFLSDSGLKNSSAKRINKGDLLYALYGATSGELAISKINGAINQAVLCIRTSLNNYFLYNYLLFKKQSILKTYLQGGQGNLSAEIVKSLEVPFPCIPEQTKIANFLSALDEKIAKTREQLEAAKLYKKGLLQQLFI